MRQPTITMLVLSNFIALSAMAAPARIVAIGTSNTNCKGVSASEGFTASMEKHLKKLGVDAVVINAGKNGDTPTGMLARLDGELTDDTKLVLFEPGANRVKSDSDKQENLGNSAKILDALKAKKIPVVFQSHYRMHSEDDARQFAKEHGAFYYGHILRNIPVNQEYRQYDMPGGHTLDPKSAGHFSAKGCSMWAEQLAPLVKDVLEGKAKL
jgi:lysophospholipase L1-like esterase